ncbi:hypothetical protein, partial [Clostridium sp. CF012]|uniref:hypothetical protein n=1 Tax=Clostridium sp. CF012 TaxID=2843319 RepID=UPI001C0E1AEE
KVKLQCANGTAGVTLWESRLSPGKKKTTKSNLVVFILRKYKNQLFPWNLKNILKTYEGW